MISWCLTRFLKTWEGEELTTACSRLVAIFLFVMASVGQAEAAPLLDSTPRIAVISAYAPEAERLKAVMIGSQVKSVNGVEFTIGKLSDKDVVLVLSGVSMVNAAMTTQLLLDHFEIDALVISGIAGGVDPALNIGDVIVPTRWGQYLETIFARETDDGFSLPPWAGEPAFANFGMMFPQKIGVRRQGDPAGSDHFWFDVDPEMLAVAKSMTLAGDLRRCTGENACLDQTPQLAIGGHGVSGQAFVDNAAFRNYAFETFKARVLDMETAAMATVAYANDVPFLAFRSLSDLAGGGPGENEIGTFFELAADNAAAVVITFLERWMPAN